MRRALGSRTKPGMCPGINDLTNHAPIAHWSHLYGASVQPETDRRGSHTSQNARCMRHPVGEDVRLSRLLGTKPECALESMVSLIALPSRIGPHLYGAPVRPEADRRGSHTS